MKKLGLLVFFILLAAGCRSNATVDNERSTSLKQFAYANCLMWYFESKNYDTDDIRAISGGIVETSDISLNKFQEIALFIKDYHPKIETKQNIDINLLRCFQLDDSDDLEKIIAE